MYHSAEVIWLRDNGVDCISSYSTPNLIRAEMGDHLLVSSSVTSHSSQLSLLPSAGQEMSTSQEAVAPLWLRSHHA